MTQYNIGQIRFQGNGCMNDMKCNVSYQSVSISSDTTTGTSDMGFQDVVIIPEEGGFSKGRDYYLRVNIPQDMNYDMNFNIKLQKNVQADNNANTYQFIKKVSLSRGGSGDNAHLVALYEKHDGSLDVCFPADYNAAEVGQYDMLYHDNNDNYYLGNGTTNYTKTNNYNDVYLIESWRTETVDTYGVFEMIFRPLEDDFVSILLEMERTPEDYNIQRTVEDNKTEYGRKITITSDNILLSQLVNQVSDLDDKKYKLSRIGIWGHPGLLMAINGEEIHIGPSGYYEQDVVAITSVGIVAPDNSWKDNWTMDYEYQIEDTEEESE